IAPKKQWQSHRIVSGWARVASGLGYWHSSIAKTSLPDSRCRISHLRRRHHETRTGTVGERPRTRRQREILQSAAPPRNRRGHGDRRPWGGAEAREFFWERGL